MNKIMIGLIFVFLIGILASCSDTIQESIFVDSITEDVNIYVQAPMLDEYVFEGKILEVEKRLPKNPVVVLPLESIGKYGGTWRRAIAPTGDFNSFTRVLPEGLIKYNDKWTKAIPNLAQSFVSNDDATEYTFVLREGIKWSDGIDFTVDDIIFWWEDLVLNKEIVGDANPPSWLIVDGENPEFEKLDDYTFKVKFVKPYGLFPMYLASVFGPIVNMYPKHYVKQFHVKYNPNVVSVAQEEGYDSWGEYLRAMVGNPLTIESLERYQNTQMPVLNAWIIKDKYEENADIIRCERNPYYFKIDTAGNQLPYIDYIEYTVTDVAGMIDLVKKGEIDMQIRHIGNDNNKYEFEQSMNLGDYDFLETLSSFNNDLVFAFNLNHKDKNLREIFQNKDFRKGMSHAINRKRIIDEVYAGRGTISQAVPRPESNFYDEEMATQYTEYSIELATSYLDNAYPNKDSEGFRLDSNGDRISFTIIVSDFNPSWEKSIPMIIDDFAVVGIEAVADYITRVEYDELRVANDYDATIWVGDGGIEVFLEPRWQFPYSDESLFAQEWQRWYNSKGKEGEEPPGNIKSQMEYYDRIKATGDQDEQNALMEKIIAVTKEEFFTIGVVRPNTGIGIIKNGFRNVANPMLYSWIWPTPFPSDPCQYYIE